MDIKERAKELGVTFADDATDEQIQALVADKEKELEASDIEYLRKELDKWKNEAKTAFAKRDQFKTDRDKLSTRIKDLEGNMKNMIPSDEKTKMEEELSELKKFKEEYDKEKEKEELKNKTELERANIEKQKLEDRFQAQIDKFQDELNNIKKVSEEEKNKSKEEIKRLRTNVLRADIVEIASKLNAWSPSQIFLLTKDAFTYDNDLEKYTYQKRGSGGKLEDEKTVEEYITDFLKNPENENLIKSGVNTKSMHTQTTQTQKKETNDLKTSKEFDPKNPKIISDAMYHNLPVEEYISKILIPQREKFNKRYRKSA